MLKKPQTPGFLSAATTQRKTTLFCPETVAAHSTAAKKKKKMNKHAYHIISFHPCIHPVSGSICFWVWPKRVYCRLHCAYIVIMTHKDPACFVCVHCDLRAKVVKVDRDNVAWQDLATSPHLPWWCLVTLTQHNNNNTRTRNWNRAFWNSRVEISTPSTSRLAYISYNCNKHFVAKTAVAMNERIPETKYKKLRGLATHC